MASTSPVIALVNFNTHEWATIRKWLIEEREDSIKALINSSSHDDSMRHRGAIGKIDKLLGAERDAKASQ